MKKFNELVKATINHANCNVTIHDGEVSLNIGVREGRKMFLFNADDENSINTLIQHLNSLPEVYKSNI